MCEVWVLLPAAYLHFTNVTRSSGPADTKCYLKLKTQGLFIHGDPPTHRTYLILNALLKVSYTNYCYILSSQSAKLVYFTM
jgi:hypothetical protein